MLIQSEVATELAGFHREEGLPRWREARRQEGKERGGGYRGGPIGRKA